MLASNGAWPNCISSKLAKPVCDCGPGGPKLIGGPAGAPLGAVAQGSRLAKMSDTMDASLDGGTIHEADDPASVGKT
eukprot:6668412-Pyramimonas_sp.AAC.1